MSKISKVFTLTFLFLAIIGLSFSNASAASFTIENVEVEGVSPTIIGGSTEHYGGPLNIIASMSNESVAIYSVNLTHFGLCAGQGDSPLADPVSMSFLDFNTSGNEYYYYNVTCAVNKTHLNNTVGPDMGEFNLTVEAVAIDGLSGTRIVDELNETIYSDFIKPNVVFSWWNTEAQQGTSTTIPRSTSLLADPDFYYSPEQNVINFSVHVTDNSNRISQVFLNLSATNLSLFTDGNCTGILNLTETIPGTGIYEGNCSLGDFNSTDILAITGGDPILSTDVIINVNDAADNSENIYNSTCGERASLSTDCIISDSSYRGEDSMNPFALVSVHDIGRISMNDSEPCMRFGNQSTNFNTVSNFSDINFVIEMQANMSCMENDPLLPTDYISMSLFNFSSVNFENQSTVQKINNLPTALNVSIQAPGSFGNSRIYINSTYFQELDAISTLNFYHLPFKTQPTILRDDDAGDVTPAVTWSSGTDPQFNNITTGNLTFVVTGFSGYNISDDTDPEVTFNNIVTGTTYGRLVGNGGINAVNVTLNGTGTSVSYFNLTINEDTYEYNYTSGTNTANCSTNDNETYTCYKPYSFVEGQNNVSALAYDFGGTNGNRDLNTTNFTYDSTAPVIVELNETQVTNSSVYISANVTGSAIGCTIVYYNGTGYFKSASMDAPGSGLFNVTLNDLAEGQRVYYQILCADSVYNYDSTKTFVMDSQGYFNSSGFETFVSDISEVFDGTETVNFTVPVRNITVVTGQIGGTNNLDAVAVNSTNNLLMLNITGNGTSNISLVELDVSDISRTGIEIAYFNLSATNLTINSTTMTYYYNTTGYTTLNESSLEFYYNNSGTWTALNNTALNTTGNYISGETTHFSEFLVAGEAEEEEEEDINGGGSTGGTSSSSGASPAGQTYTFQFGEDSVMRSMRVNDALKFQFRNEEHKVELISLSSSSVLLRISSDPIEVTVNLGETEEVDIDGDGINDMSIYLRDISLGVADLSFKQISEPTTEPEETNGTETTDVNGTETTETTEITPTEKSNLGMYVVVVLIAIFAGIAIWYFFFRNR